MVPKRRVGSNTYGRRASCIRAKGDGQRPLDEARVIMPERVTIKRVRIPFAESLRFPGEGKSAQGESGPKARPKGVADGQQVNIPAPVLWTSRVTLRGMRAARQSWPSRKGEGTYDPEVSGGGAEKSLGAIEASGPY